RERGYFTARDSAAPLQFGDTVRQPRRRRARQGLTVKNDPQPVIWLGADLNRGLQLRRTAKEKIAQLELRRRARLRRACHHKRGRSVSEQSAKLARHSPGT